MAGRAAAFAASIALSAAVLAFLWFRKGVAPREIGETFLQADKTILVAVIVASAAFHIFVGAHKLWCVLRAMGVDISYVETLQVRLGAGPLRVLVPLSAGELLNVFYFWRHKRMPFGRASGASIFDRGLNILGAFFWLLVGLAILPGAWPDAWPTHWHVPLGADRSLPVPLRTGLFVAAIGLYVLFFFCTPMHGLAIRAARTIHPKVGRLAEGMLAPFMEFRLSKKLFFTGYAVFFQLRPLAVAYFLFRAYGTVMDLGHVVAYTSVAVFAAHLPGFVGGIGPRDYVFMTLFPASVDEAIRASVGLLQSIVVHIIPMLLGLPWMMWFLKRMVRREPEGEGPTEPPTPG